MRNSLSDLKNKMRTLSDPKRAQSSQRYFKTGKGEYAEGDKFIGLTVPQVRSLLPQSKQLSLSEIKLLLGSKIHEERLLALLTLVALFEKGDQSTRDKIFKIYFSFRKHINNWDLVDTSASTILGQYLGGSHKTLKALAKSKNLWDRRMAMIAQFHEIKTKNPKPALDMAKTLLHDEHDLIHKAVGWMLREIGNRSGILVLEDFLKHNYHTMPRTMLRYAIERLPEAKRQAYLKGKI